MTLDLDALRERLVALVCVAASLLVACSDGSAPDASARAAASAATPDRDVAAAALPAPVTARFVKLEALSERSGGAWTSVAEFNLVDATGATIDRKAWRASADSADVNDPASNAIDGNPRTLWHTRWQGEAPPAPPHELVVDLGSPLKLSAFRYLPRQDKSPNGVIAKFRFYASSDGVQWGEPLASGDFGAMGGAGAERTVAFAKQTANHPPVAQGPAKQSSTLGQAVSLQLVASDEDGDPLSFSATGLPTGLALAPTTGRITGTPIEPGNHKVAVEVRDNKGASASVAFEWSVQAPAPLANAVAAPGEVRFVKLEALSEVHGKPWTSMAEFNLVDASGKNLPRTGWTASADSADTSDRPGNAIDGNAQSIWHSQWDGASPPPPHTFIVDMGHTAVVRGFRYLPRQDRLDNGMIARFRFFTSSNGTDWGAPVAEGDFSTLGKAKDEKTVPLH